MEKILSMFKKGKSILSAMKRLSTKTRKSRKSGGTFEVDRKILSAEDLRLIIIECTTDADAKLGKNLCSFFEGNTVKLILRRDDSGNVLSEYPKSLFKNVRGRFVQSSFELLKILYPGTSCLPAHEIVVISLNNADLPPESLQRAYKRYQEHMLEFAYADFGQFTSADFIFCKGVSLLLKGDKAEYIAGLHSDNLDHLIWPSREDDRYYYIDRFEKYYALPQSLSLDLMPGCNKHCEKCQYHSMQSPYRDQVKRREFMDPDLAERVLKEAATWAKKPALSTSFSGEPLVYPYLERVLSFAKKLGYVVGVTTNGMALTDERAKLLLDLKIDSVCFSIDAFTQETYSRLQPPGLLDKVKTNIEKFLKYRESSLFKPYVAINYVMDESNINEFDDFKSYWLPKMDSITRSIRQNQFPGCAPVMKPFYNVGERHVCWALWFSLYVRYDGRLSFCGADIVPDGDLDVTKMSILDAWNSPEYWKWRNAQLDDEIKMLFCKGCLCWTKNRISLTRDNAIISQTPVSETYTKL